ncbi:MAG: gamma-glutamyl-gamma-aminobutyrate hydrolase family protein [Chloroflexi bacterium]|nr:MAG: gamma-glutamyl-gamma-aminobutyrate hydrolase family protein [Chloroflexota bacterium]MBL1195746.1 gamma-glutamyl-gamma-aminobutyrate hydrolase family protein [Chloroflexota bacterium]NOH13035.1 gamma-glutamyl-gamma-aminobutyrate hydrolase family protein [Chloroflexota bacterium]
MSAPLIGITTRNTQSQTYDIPLVASPKSYIQALSRAGAIPVLIPLGSTPEATKQLLSRLDGIVFTGGGDIETQRFGGEDHAEVYDVDPERDAMELGLIHDVVDSETPFLGICRGAQVVNVAYGGSLYTHIADQHPDAVEHTFFPGHPWDHLAHPVQVTEGSKLADIVGKPILPVNSLHHQGIKELAANLEPVAHAPDGLIEALELPDYPFGLAVQWHPEWLPEDPYSLKLFDSFVAAASNGHK